MAVTELLDYYKPKSFADGWGFAELHMPAVRSVLDNLPVKMFMNVNTAPTKKDMEQATDLVLSVNGIDIAVRVRRHKFFKDGNKLFGLDWSIRSVNNGHLTEIQKLQSGFGRWYFYGYSKDDKGQLIRWYLIDLDIVRNENILTMNYPEYPNGDGTSGKYIPINKLYEIDCIIATDEEHWSPIRLPGF
jgi:hypothetical protein